MPYFATLLDYNYLSRLLALHASIGCYHKSFILYIVCLDDKLYDHLSNNQLEHTVLVSVKQIEQFYPELQVLKKERKPIDYIFTLSPYYPSFILERYPDTSFICSLDVDQYFFSNCESIFDDLKNYSVLIMPHRFPDKLKHHEKYGTYNVSFQVFKNDEIGVACLKLWREQCFAWCKDELEGDKFADQKYLNSWKDFFENKVRPIDNPGVGLAPWNIENYPITLRNGNVYVGDNKLILFHYQGLRFLNSRLVNSGFSYYQVATNNVFVHNILRPIITHLSKASKKRKDTIRRVISEDKKGLVSQINAEGFYYILGEKVINMDRVYYLNNYRKKISGLFNRFKNIYRQAR
jgi:hypothetical protein